MLEVRNRLRSSLVSDRSSRVIFTNGKIDPWHALGIVDSKPDKDLPAYLMAGTGTSPLSLSFLTDC